MWYNIGIYCVRKSTTLFFINAHERNYLNLLVQSINYNIAGFADKLPTGNFLSFPYVPWGAAQQLCIGIILKNMQASLLHDI